MSNGDDRLMRCFTSVFPSASQNEIRTAKLNGITGWDSLRGVTLLAVLDEEFGIQIDLGELLELSSYEGIRQHLSNSQVS